MRSPCYYLGRHLFGDFGRALAAEDTRHNEASVKSGEGRIISRYVLKTGVVLFITTEADRSVTTIFLPFEY